MHRIKVTDHQAVYLLTETARALGHDPRELMINRKTIRQKRMEHRESMAKNIREEFKGHCPLVVLRDRKLMKDLTSKEHVDHLLILVSGSNVQQLLLVAKLPNGTGLAQATVVVESVEN